MLDSQQAMQPASTSAYRILCTLIGDTKIKKKVGM